MYVCFCVFHRAEKKFLCEKKTVSSDSVNQLQYKEFSLSTKNLYQTFMILFKVKIGNLLDSPPHNKLLLYAL